MYGKGLLQGMAVTFRNFVDSYVTGQTDASVLDTDDPYGGEDGITTVCYPEQKVKHPENFRFFPFLVFDETPDDPRCTACRICERECPPQCISIEMQKDDNGKAMQKPLHFDIDMSICMSCQICVEVCPFQAIYMDHDFALSAENRFDDLVFRKDRLLKSHDYHLSIKPEEATAAKELVLEEKRKKAEAMKKKAAAAAARKAKAAASRKEEAPGRTQDKGKGEDKNKG